MNPKLSLALFQCLIASSGSPFGVQSQCKYANARQLQACLKQEHQRVVHTFLFGKEGRYTEREHVVVSVVNSERNPRIFED
mgnify:CR=1 FL=1